MINLIGNLFAREDNDNKLIASLDASSKSETNAPEIELDDSVICESSQLPDVSDVPQKQNFVSLDEAFSSGNYDQLLPQNCAKYHDKKEHLLLTGKQCK